MYLDIFAHILPEKFYQRLVDVSAPGVRNMQKRVSGIDLDTLALDAKTRTAIEMGNARRLLKL